MVGERPMRIQDKRFRNCICPNIRNGIDCMQKLGELIMIKRVKSLERRIR
jgi:hypothetical protein